MRGETRTRVFFFRPSCFIDSFPLVRARIRTPPTPHPPAYPHTPTPAWPPPRPPPMSKMYVLKRDGRKEAVSFDKITARITKLSYALNTDFCDPVRLERRGEGGGCVWLAWGVGVGGWVRVVRPRARASGGVVRGREKARRFFFLSNGAPLFCLGAAPPCRRPRPPARSPGPGVADARGPSPGGRGRAIGSGQGLPGAAASRRARQPSESGPPPRPSFSHVALDVRSPAAWPPGPGGAPIWPATMPGMCLVGPVALSG